ncbi:hypothetical protein HY412_02085 [Candidatus Kaiserbacteria bacterium]|nr:hypothetical protein [Candidatus Kaiserbacteria bacterium]
MKKTILIAVVIIFFGFAPHVFAEGFVALAPIPGLTKDIVANTEGLAAFFNNLYKFAIGIAAALAVIQIIWGGIEIAVNKDNVSKIIDSKGRILQAVLGLVLVLSPVLVFSIINPSILNLSINLRELDTRTAPAPTVTPTGTPVPGTISSYSEVQSGSWCYSSRRTGTFRCWPVENDCRIVALRELGSAGQTACSLTP